MIEIKGQQLRIRVENPKSFIKSSFRTHDVGKRGRLQRVSGRLKSSGKWSAQSWRVNLKDYPSLGDVYEELNELSFVANFDLDKAKRLAFKWWR